MEQCESTRPVSWARYGLQTLAACHDSTSQELASPSPSLSCPTCSTGDVPIDPGCGEGR